MTVYSAIKRQYLPDDLLSIYTSSQQIATIIIKATIITLITAIIIAIFIINIILHTSTQTIIIFCSYHCDCNTGCPQKSEFASAPWIKQFSESHYFLKVTISWDTLWLHHCVYTHFFLTNRLHHVCNFVSLMIIIKIVTCHRILAIVITIHTLYYILYTI